MVDKRIIIGAGGAVVIAGGLIAHHIAGNSAEKQIEQSLAALKDEPAIAVSDVETHRGWGKTSVSAHLDAVEVPGVSGDLDMDVGYMSRSADGTLALTGEALGGSVDFTAGLGSGRQDYSFHSDALSADDDDMTLDNVEGDGYVNIEREHFAFNMQARHTQLQKNGTRLSIDGAALELEHNLAADQGEGRSHVQMAADGAEVTAANRGGTAEALSLGPVEVRNTATLDGDTLSSQLYLVAEDAVFMGSEPGRAELDVTASQLDYAAFEALAEVLERHLDDAKKNAAVNGALSPAQQQALNRDLGKVMVEQAHTLLAHSPELQLETLSLDAAVPFLDRAEAQLSGSLTFDGDDLPRDATNALLANIDAETRRLVVESQGRPAMSQQQALAELAPRLSSELAVTRLPDAIVAELPPALGYLMTQNDAPHVFAWQDGELLYNGEPLAQALPR